jgi:hypothetical protein
MYISISAFAVRTAFETGSDGVIAKNKYRTSIALADCPEGRLLTTKDTRDYIGINTFF